MLNPFFPSVPALAATLVLTGTMAQATVIGFETGTYAQLPANQTYSEAGYTFTTGLNDHFDSNDFPGNTVFPGGLPYLVFHEAEANPTNNIVTLDFGGAAFDLLRFDLATDPRVLQRNPVINPAMTIMGSSGATMTSTAGLVGQVDVNFLNVTSVTFDIIGMSSRSGNVILDNVVVRPASRPTTIPLPASGWLLLAGLGAVGMVLRRRRS